MIKPHNPKLVNFRFVVTLAWYVDFGVTTFLISNYKFHLGDEKYHNFVYHKTFYYWIIIVQIFAIISNFFVIVQLEHDEVTLPYDIAKLYLKGNFVADLFSAFPYHVYKPNLVFIRLIQSAKWY